MVRHLTAVEAARPTISAIGAAALPGLGMLDRLLLRSVALIGRSKVHSISGAERIAAARDPFILALNHNSRLEALLVPALLVLLREGRRIHFLADWNFRLIPGVGLLYRRAGAITVPNKRARPRALNLLKPAFVDGVPPMARARELLLSGASVGIFPEGKVNRDPHVLLRGRLGAARLSLETGVPVVPAGLRPVSTPAGPMSIEIGAPLTPPSMAAGVDGDDVRAWHAQIMSAIAVLSGKSQRLQPKGASDEAVRADENEARPVSA